jgi:hypothetical protein
MSVRPWLKSIGLGSCQTYFVISTAQRQQWGNVDELSTLASLDAETLEALVDALLPHNRDDLKKRLLRHCTDKLERPVSPNRAPTPGSIDEQLHSGTTDAIVRRSRVALRKSQQSEHEAYAQHTKAARASRGRRLPPDDPSAEPLRSAWQASVASKGKVRCADGGNGEPWDPDRLEPINDVDWGGRWMSTGLNGIAVGRADKHLAGRIPEQSRYGSTSGLYYK